MIDGIEEQPGAEVLSAAYRPVIYQVVANRTDGDPIPPVVYCDIYINGIFYKTISKTQYKEIVGSFTLWEFDIQDAAQEYLGKYLGALYGNAILTAPPLIAQVLCSFRSSGYDVNDFILPEGTAPIQGTGDQAPTAGAGGSDSSVSYIVNSTLQHDQAQDLATHLISYNRLSNYVGGVFPMTHRPLNYFLCRNDSDYFPILSNIPPTGVRVDWENKDGTTGSSDSDPICTPVSLPTFSLPNAKANEPYLVIVPISGTAAFDFNGSTSQPDWMDIVIDGSSLVFSGTPGSGDVGTHLQVSVSLQNCDGDSIASFTKYIDVTTCVAVSFGTVLFADAIAGVPYNKTIPLSGTAPFIIDGIGDLPAWMDVEIVGSTIQFFGTPTDGDVDTGEPISVDIVNCSGHDLVTLSATINVLVSTNFTLDAAWNFKINSATGTNAPAIGPTTVNGRKQGHHTGLTGDYTVSITGTTVAITSIIVYINGEFSQCALVSNSIGVLFTNQEYHFTITAGETDQVKFSIVNFFCD